MFDKASILILGGTGYIGNSLYQGLIKRNADAFRAGRNTIIDDSRYISLDITDREQFHKILQKYRFDFVINAIGHVHTLQNNQYEINNDLIKGNIESVMYIFDCINSANLSNVKFINFSTMSVYGIPTNLPVDEKHETTPQNSYGISKLIGERIIEYYSINYNIPVLNLRVPGVFGGNRKNGAIYNFINNALLNKDIVINTAGLKLWSIIYIETLVEIIYKIINNYNWYDTYKNLNVGYGENIDIIDVANVIVQRLNSNSNILIQKPIDYCKFYLSNDELKKIIDISYDYITDIDNYIEILKSGESQ